MFKIYDLIFYSKGIAKGYYFKSGINYFVGKNNTGKTEFYSLLDYMFGASDSLKKISEKECYKDLVDMFSMKIAYENKTITLKRTLNPEINYIETKEESNDEPLSQEMYCNRLNSFFTKDELSLRDLRDFVGEDFSFRTFTMFNFLSEKRQGYTQNFLSKCSETKYWLKQEILLNYLFNNHLAEVRNKEKEIKNKEKELSEKQIDLQNGRYILNKVNENLAKLSLNLLYTGSNTDKVKSAISNLKNMDVALKADKEKNISDLEVKYNCIFEQIKQYNNEIQDVSLMNKDNVYRKKLIENLIHLVERNSELDYLVAPSLKILKNLENTVAFGSYITKDETVKKLNKELIKVKESLKKNESRFQLYSLDEKRKSIAIVEDYLDSSYKYVDENVIEQLQKEIRQLKSEVKRLKNDDSVSEIKKFSDEVTFLYHSAKDASSFVNDDFDKNGFRIQYLKKGNVLQPMERIVSEKNGIKESIDVNYFPGSMARHTMIQLCGYLAFLKKLIAENRYPLIPLLVIDHISKSFDDDNKKAVNSIIQKAISNIGKENLQIFMFDTESAESFGIDASCVQYLVDKNRSGFCPFYKGVN